MKSFYCYDNVGMVTLTTGIGGDGGCQYVDEALPQGEVVDPGDRREELPEERDLAPTHVTGVRLGKLDEYNENQEMRSMRGGSRSI